MCIVSPAAFERAFASNKFASGYGMASLFNQNFEACEVEEAS